MNYLMLLSLGLALYFSIHLVVKVVFILRNNLGIVTWYDMALPAVFWTGVVAFW